jgi:hypothetical protein
MIRHRAVASHGKFALHLTRMQQPGIGGLGVASKTYCKFLAVDGWIVEGERSIMVLGCGLR